MADAHADPLPFSLPNPVRGRLTRRLTRSALGAAESLLGLSQLNSLYRAWLDEGRRRNGRFCEDALEILDIALEARPDGIGRIPATGSVIIVANHPHGALDGLALAALVRTVRPDVRLLGNALLAQVPELRQLCLFVSPFEAHRGSTANTTGLRDAFEWVLGGGALVVFPAGEVSHATSARGRVADSAWHSGVIRLAERTAAPVLPVLIEGTNSDLFQLAGLVHPMLRTLMLPRELLRQRSGRVRIRIGDAIAWSRLESLRTTGDRLAYLRLRTYALEDAAKPFACVPAEREAAAGARPTISPVAPEALRADIAALDPSRLLLRRGNSHVYCASAAEVPNVLREIGRLREVTFRAAGEGTGNDIDLDRFDARYWHLFVWEDARAEIAGAYRIGTSEPSRNCGGRGLYTRSLFRYGRRFLGELGPALELGRSFVREQSQRDYGTLLLLWKGIGHVVARHPQYRMLFGPVSISADYSAASRELLVAALSGPRFASGLTPLVRPRRALEVRQPRVGEPGTALTADVLDALLREAEPDGKGLPVLLRQYLRLGGRLASFSVDPAFGNVVDGLMVVDLAQVAPPLLQRYMGREGAASFLAFHRTAPPSADCEPVVASA